MSEEPTPREVSIDILTKAYEEADPGLNFEDLMENPDDYPNDYYLQHELDSERLHEILEEHLSQHDFSEQEESGIVMTVLLDYAPTDPASSEGRNT